MKEPRTRQKFTFILWGAIIGHLSGAETLLMIELQKEYVFFLFKQCHFFLQGLLLHIMSLNLEQSSQGKNLLPGYTQKCSSQHNATLLLNGTLMQTPGHALLGMHSKDQGDLHQHFLSIPDPGLLTLWGIMPTFSAANLTELFSGIFIPFN